MTSLIFASIMFSKETFKITEAAIKTAPTEKNVKANFSLIYFFIIIIIIIKNKFAQIILNNILYKFIILLKWRIKGLIIKNKCKSKFYA